MRIPTLRSLMTGVAVLAVSALVASPALAQKTKITVYTALENDQLGPYKQAFETANPDVEIAWVRDSTGVVTAKRGDEDVIGDTVSGAPPTLHTFSVATCGVRPHDSGNTTGPLMEILGGTRNALSRKKMGSS